MAVTLYVESFNNINLHERAELTTDVIAGATTLILPSTEGFEPDDVIYVGQLSQEGCERAVVASITDATTIALSAPLELAHSRLEPVTSVLGDSIRIYRAADVDGTQPADGDFTSLVVRTIDPDQPSTYYRDPTGSSSFWYRSKYLNPVTLDETDWIEDQAHRGDDAGHYASLLEIRREAGFMKAVNLKDTDIDQQRRAAESEINAALSDLYTVPFNPVPEIIHTLTVKLAAVFLLIVAYGMTRKNEKLLKDIRAELDGYATGKDSIPGAGGEPLPTTSPIDGYPDSSAAPRSFYIGQKF